MKIMARRVLYSRTCTTRCKIRVSITQKLQEYSGAADLEQLKSSRKYAGNENTINGKVSVYTCTIIRDCMIAQNQNKPHTPDLPYQNKYIHITKANKAINILPVLPPCTRAKPPLSHYKYNAHIPAISPPQRQNRFKINSSNRIL